MHLGTSIPTSINQTKNICFWTKNICFWTKYIWAHAAPKSCKTLMFGKCLFHPLMQQVGVGSQSVHRLMLQAAACQDCCKCGAPRHSMPPCIIIRPYCWAELEQKLEFVACQWPRNCTRVCDILPCGFGPPWSWILDLWRWWGVWYLRLLQPRITSYTSRAPRPRLTSSLRCTPELLCLGPMTPKW